MKKNNNIIIDKKEEIYNCIVDFIKEHKYPPTIREIGKIVGLKSTCSVHTYLTRMQIDGKLTFHDESPRTIALPGYAFIKIPEGMTEEDLEKHIEKFASKI